MRWTLPFRFAALVVTAAALVTPVQNTFAVVSAFDDPAARADLQLGERLTPLRLSQELDDALARGDETLAASFVELADERGLQVSEAQRKTLADLRAQAGQKSARDFISGFADGETHSMAALSGAIAADLSGYGDVRDLTKEGRKWFDGEEPDQIVIALSAAGLAISAATWTSLGAAMPVRGGISLVKALQKAGRLSKSLTQTLSRSAANAIDREALRAMAAAVTRFELTAARQTTARLIRPKALAEFRTLGSDVATLRTKAGVRGAQEVLSTAENSAEIGQAAKLAAIKGSKTRAILKVLGRGVLIVGEISWTLAAWLFALISYFFAAASFARRLGESMGRLVWSSLRLARNA